ncbi:GntR family transcriptional regulator [Jannaschia sp. LMIT008]|uniref:GntR family transcriptional regulator n=1 Tax=Jannaschia maritima TaxID=3032585 RepID=UPI0028124D1D|nr:GntR family transcriptional regulator [Jannaschia sp. LMIT008]
MPPPPPPRPDAPPPAEGTQPVRRNRFIHDTLRDAIGRGALPPGLVLTESALARLFDVSRAPASDALALLAAEGLVARHDGRGFLVGDGTDPPLRRDLDPADLDLPQDGGTVLAARSARETLYPRVEVEVAAATGYGSFLVTSGALARHYGVSRTTSQELLTRLERVGLVEQSLNGRWVAPRLTPEAVAHHYEMRRLLEPVALRHVCAPDRAGATAAAADAALRRIAALRAAQAPPGADDITAVEDDLHAGIVLACPNPRMRDTIRRSQLPLIATHAAFDRYRSAPEMERVLADHEGVLRALRDADPDRAAARMARHLDQGERTTIAYVAADPTAPPGVVRPYMVAVEG